MGDKTGIEWTDATWNPVTGCTKVSPGCKHCYAKRVFPRVYGRQIINHVDGPRPRVFENVWTHPDRLPMPIHWRRPRRIFVNSMSDLFHENVPFGFVDEVLAVAVLSPQHTFQILTKRAERMFNYFDYDLRIRYVVQAIYNLARQEKIKDIPQWDWPLRNVHMGISAENQETYDERVHWLNKTPARVRWISAEPLLGPIDMNLESKVPSGQESELDNPDRLDLVDWVVVGGESGPEARPMHPEWVAQIRHECQRAGVPFLFKQWGEWTSQPTHKQLDDECIGADTVLLKLDGTQHGWGRSDNTPFDGSDACMYRIGKRAAGRVFDGVTWNQYPVTP